MILVSMPFVSPKRPSIGLSLLKASLSRAGIGCRVDYANLDFVARAGLDDYLKVAAHSGISVLGEWVFAGALFPDFHPDHQRFFEDWVGTARGGPRDQQLPEVAWKLRRLALDFVEETAQRLVAQKPALIGCSSTFVQHCASLALLRRVRQLDPSIVTVMGGANCDGCMGPTTRRQFPWVDYVISGEADEVLVEIARAARAGQKLPHPEERFLVQNVRDLPCPEFDDYFETLTRLGLDRDILPCIPLETSRGCWWGQKHHCTFCGLNGGGMQFRLRPAEKSLADLEFLSTRHGVREVLMVDKIMDMSYLNSFLPRLAEQDRSYEIFYETKANLRKDQLQVMARAGVTYIQAGIESLQDDLLELMDKGTTAMQNLQLLKWSRELGIHVTWLMLFGFPGEKIEWYAEMAEFLPWLVHLQPPNALVQVGYHRFSPYFERAAHYGLDLQSDPGYNYVYPFPEEIKKDLVYSFVDRADLERPRDRALEAQRLIGRSLALWRHQFWGGAPAILSMDDEDGLLTIWDTRPGAPQRRSSHAGLAREILLRCDGLCPRSRLEAELGPECPAELQKLLDLKLILDYRGQLLTLATRGDLPSLRRRIPTGHVRAMVEV